MNKFRQSVFLPSAVILLAAASIGAPASAAEAAPATPKIHFTEIGAKAGVRVTHNTRRFSGKNADVLRMFTSGGASAAVGDFDNDGFDDLFVTDSDTGKPNHLFRNNGKGGFVDVTGKAGVAGGNDAKSIVADALWFDYDNDGWVDLLVVRFGTSLLYHNEKNGKFKDVSAQSGLTTFGNAIAAIAFDYDADGTLDLLFGNYFKPENLIELKSPNVLPNDLDAAVNGGGVTLYRGLGKGKFLDVTKKAGLSHHSGWTLDAGHGDLNNDGWQDIYLACDYGPDRVFFNNGDGTFKDISKTAIGIDTKKGMNVDIADYDRDGWLDVYVTNITDEYMKECNMLWHNNGDGTFTDVSKETGTCQTLWGWGAKFGDFDNDGWEDIFVVDGLRSAGEENYIPVLLPMITTPGIDFTDVNNWPAIGEMTWSGYQKKKLFRNLGTGAFKEISAEAGVDNDQDGRGIGLGDFDNDGRLDLYQTNADQPALLYQNDSSAAGNWVDLRLVGTKSNRDAIGARVTLRSGGVTIMKEVNGGNGYAAQATTRLHFGLATAKENPTIEIRWPSGIVQKATVPVNKITRIEEDAKAGKK